MFGTGDRLNARRLWRLTESTDSSTGTGTTYLRNNHRSWKFLWSLFIPVRGKPHSSFPRQPQRCRETFIKWRSPCREESLFSPEAHLAADQSQSSLSRNRAPCPPRPGVECDWCIVGSMGGVLCHFPASPAVPYLVAFDRTSLSCS